MVGCREVAPPSGVHRTHVRILTTVAVGGLLRARSSGPPPAERLSEAVLSRDRLLPVSEALRESIPHGGLPRGTTTLVTPAKAGGALPAGATSLALELLAGASADGKWCAAIGLPDLGLAAALERGIALERLLLVPSPGGRWQQVLATCFDGLDAVLFSPACQVRPGEARRLSARAKDRGAAFVVLDQRGYFPGAPDLCCRVLSSVWRGLHEGHGLLSERFIEVEVSGRGAAARPLRSAVSLSCEMKSA